MAQIYKVFINDRPLLFCNTTEKSSLKYGGISQLEELIISLQTGRADTIELTCDSVPDAWADFCSLFEIIDAAGGMVYNESNELLVIHRLGKWDLPKGKCEEGETIEESAIREVEEECAVEGLVLGESLPTTYHTYTLKGKAILKRTFWFQMTAPKQEVKPQTEEGITEVVWMARDRWQEVLDSTYASIAELIQGQMA